MQMLTHLSFKTEFRSLPGVKEKLVNIYLPASQQEP